MGTNGPVERVAPNQPIQWKRFTALLPLLLVVIVPAWSDVRTATGNATKKTCYCNCDTKPGAPMCTMMCELPKYQNRSWAKSCEKKHSPSRSAAPDERSHSKKTNKVQDASL
jgi:hypothetical protein